MPGTETKGKRGLALVVQAMQEKGTIISSWLAGKSKKERDSIVRNAGSVPSLDRGIPIEGILEQFAVRVLAACAEDLGLSTVELSGLLKEPRKDALSGLITVIKDGE